MKQWRIIWLAKGKLLDVDTGKMWPSWAAMIKALIRKRRRTR